MNVYFRMRRVADYAGVADIQKSVAVVDGTLL
jgi:hypothetical protein